MSSAPSDTLQPSTDDTEYPPIEAYGVIGDGRTAALVSRQGSVDWLCLPDFPAPAVFAALLDRHRGGRFAIRPAGAYRTERRYVGATNVLETTFATATGRVRVTDCMPITADSPLAGWLQSQRELLRVVELLEGTVELEVRCQPQWEFGRRPMALRRLGRGLWVHRDGRTHAALQTDLPLSVREQSEGVHGWVTLSRPGRYYASFSYTRNDTAVLPGLGRAAEARLEATRDWWTRWSARCTYDGPDRDAVVRSALTLKLLTFALSGAVVAAPTTSLPEKIGGKRNWDYRYCWLRDTALTLRCFTRLGYFNETGHFLTWLLHTTRPTWPHLRVLYGLYGKAELPEHTVPWLAGYRNSRPVRLGNAAYDQFQLDLYGELILSLHDYVVHGGRRLGRQEARRIAGLARYLQCHWRDPDRGIWESRGGPRQHTYSKLMCWVAFDRLLKLTEEGHLALPEDTLRRERDAVRDVIETQGYHPDLDAYTGVFGEEIADASVLLLAMTGFAPANDPRMQRTFDFLERRLGQNGFLRRFEGNYDNVESGEGAFGPCSFWAVNYLARAGRVQEARDRFEHLLACANDLGLFSEEIDPDSGALLGNFPQAFTHEGLITAALALARAEEAAAARRTA